MAIALRNPFEPLRRVWENMTERERVLVSILGVVVVVMAVILPVVMLTLSIGDLETQNREMTQVLRDIARERPRLAQREREMQRQEQRYANEAPPLGSFLEAKASEVQLTLREVTDQPEQVSNGFRRRNVRAQLPGVGLRPVIDLMSSVAGSNYPVAVERIHIEHFQNGDRYNIQLGILAYDKMNRAPAAGAEPAADGEEGGEGPPAP